MSLQGTFTLAGLFFIPWLVLGLLLAIRWGIGCGLGTSFAVVLVSGLLSWGAMIVLQPREKLMEELYPATEWEIICRVEARPVAFDYRESEGLFLKTDQGEKLLATGRGVGLPLGEVRRFHDDLMRCQDTFPWIIVNPDSSLISPPRSHPLKELELPPPPGEPVAEMLILLQYPRHGDARALVGYAAYEYGLVICSERFLESSDGEIVDDVLSDLDYYLPTFGKWFGASALFFTFVAIGFLSRFSSKNL